MSEIIKAAFARALVASAIAGLIGGIWFWVIDRDHFLKSDDPYIVGFLLGAVAAVGALIYGVFEVLLKRRWLASLVYWTVVGLWCGFIVWGWLSGAGREVQELLPVIAGASFLAGTISWVVSFLDVPRWLTLAGVGAWLLILILYGIAAYHLR